jgi:hypothetical protein
VTCLQKLRTVAHAALKRSEVKIHQLNTLDNGKPIGCPGGLIHHWVGVVSYLAQSWTMCSAS